MKGGNVTGSYCGGGGGDGYWTERCEIWGSGLFVRVLKFDSPLPEDHRVNTFSTADSLHHH